LERSRLEKDSGEDVRRISGINEAALGEIETVQSGRRSCPYPAFPLRIPSAKRIGLLDNYTAVRLHRWLSINPKQNFGKLQQVERPSAAYICDSVRKARSTSARFLYAATAACEPILSAGKLVRIT
jgi:hypothetical protein